MEGFLIHDQRGDTLIYSERLEVAIRKFDFRENNYRLGRVRLVNPDFHLAQIDSSGVTNLDFLTDYFKSGEADTLPKAPISLSARRIFIENGSFSFVNPYSEPVSMGMDFNRLFIDSIQGEFVELAVQDDSVLFSIEDFSFAERSGFELYQMKADAVIGPNAISTSNLYLQTNNSTIQGRLALEHETWSNYQHFLSEVSWDASFSSSKINFLDIGFFAPELYGVNFPITLHGRVEGPIENLKGRNLVLLAGDRTVLRGNLDLTGLPDFENTFIDFRITQLSSDYNDLNLLSDQLMVNDPLTEELPIEIKRAGSLFFTGSFTGFPQDFVTYGSLNTEAGDLDLDLNLKRDTLAGGIQYSGGVQSFGLDAGKIFGMEELGLISAEVDMEAFSDETFIKADLKGVIDLLEFRNYPYRDIQLDGTVTQESFSGELYSDDPNFDIDFVGVIDFSAKVPYYDFDASVNNIDLSALNLVSAGKQLQFSSILTLNGYGNNIENARGRLEANDSFLCYGDSSIFIDDLTLNIVGDSLNRKISLTSNVVDITITGAFNPLEIPNSFNNLLAEVMPSLASFKPVSQDEVFEFSVNYKSENRITGLLLDRLYISPGTTAYGIFNSNERSFELSLRSPELSYGSYRAQNINVDLGKISEILKARVFGSAFYYNDFIFENPDADLEAYNDFIDLNLGWFGGNENTSADINADVDFYGPEKFVVQIEPGFVGTSGLKWTLDSSAVIRKDSTLVTVSNLLIHHQNQEIEVNGRISKNPADSLRLTVRDLDLELLDTLGLAVDPSLKGTLNATAFLRDVYGKPLLVADLTVDSLGYSGYEIGRLVASSRYAGDKKKILLRGALQRASLELLSFEGAYALDSEEPLDGVLFLDEFDLNLLNALEIPEVSEFSGRASGEIGVKGRFEEPMLSGYVDFDRALFKVEYLNVFFRFSDRVRVEPDFFGIDYKPIYDQRGNKGFVVASAFHENFKNWTYDISADVNDFLVLNTTREQNSLYFGEASATGSLQLGGFEDMLEINIDARTEKGTSIKLPLDEQEDVTLENFVRFVNTKAEDELDREVDLEGVRMRLNVDATPDAEIMLIFDEQAGDILKGRGSGQITLETTETGEFNMFGRYEIRSGTYNFTLKSLINKQFDLRPGGTIGWYGDPYNADLDMSALYSLRTPLYPIMIENRELYRTRELVNVVMKLGGKLENPSISFDVELPQATENERSQLSSAINSVNQLNKQVFSLLILNRFIAISAAEQAGSGVVSGLPGAGLANTSELIGNQLSNWLSDISNQFDIGVNYRPGDQITNQEIAVALSTQLFNERLMVSGSLGVTSANQAQYTQAQSGILGDFLLEYLLTQDGKIRLKVFNETNPYDVFSAATSMYTQGVGLIYQEDFDTLDEFFQKVGSLFSDDKAKPAGAQP